MSKTSEKNAGRASKRVSESAKSDARPQATADQFEQAFTEDHQVLTQGLLDLLHALGDNDFLRARTLAREIDEKSGAHIQFEEEHLYPELLERRDPEFVIRLYHEHELGREAVSMMVNRAPDVPFSDDERTALMAKLQIALEHAYTCGSLLSYASAIEPKLQSRLLTELHRCRVEGHLWSELPQRQKSVAAPLASVRPQNATKMRSPQKE